MTHKGSLTGSLLFYICCMNVNDLVQNFGLAPHPEGGYYKETYRSAEKITAVCLPGRFGGERNFSTAIYFLLESGNFSAFHRIKSDECWHFYAGQALLIHVISKDGSLNTVTLGNDIRADQQFQYVVEAGSWFASEVAPGSDFSFVGCTVSPGFDFADFEMAKAADLIASFPQHELIIKRLCRQ